MHSLARELRPKRDFLVKALTENGFNPTIPEAGYFVVADWTKLGNYDIFISSIVYFQIHLRPLQKQTANKNKKILKYVFPLQLFDQTVNAC